VKLIAIKRKFEELGIRHAKLGVFDIDGVLRGKHVSLDKLWSAGEHGLGFCDVIFGWDMADALYDNVRVTGWHTGYPDARLSVDLDTMRAIPWEPGTALFLLDVQDAKGAPPALAPRQLLQQVVGRAESLGYAPYLAAEYEFFLFRETPQSLHEKSFRNLTPLSPGMFGYSVVRASAHSDLVLALLDQLAAFDIPLEGLHTETGPGVYEAALAVTRGVAAGDRAALFKTAVKEIAARHNLVATFMAKWNAELPGCGGHIHQSLGPAEGERNLFHDAKEPHGISTLMRHYIAGLVANLPELTVMLCPTINSYKRMVPGVWAPLNATWGIENRTAAVRAIPTATGKATRVELRVPGADLNPYLAMAASLAAGLDGLERKLEPPAPVTNAYTANATPLPRTLAEATALFRQSEVAKRWFGADFVEHYAATREWEVRQYDKAVTDWEVARYFEVI
jgi:glutamine synthetase